jgi:hypothetical protein
MHSATAYGHAQGEAYMLMTYRCVGNPAMAAPSCGASEVVWNSRDGVTPFVISCRQCGSHAQHIDWDADAYAPHHVPEIGDRIFVDLTYERALARRRDYVHRWWDDPDRPMRDHDVLGPLGPEGAAADLAQGDLDQFGSGTPDLVEVTSDVQQWLQGGGY